MQEWFFDATMKMLLLICFGCWGLGRLTERHPRASRLAARGAFHLFKSFLR